MVSERDIEKIKAFADSKSHLVAVYVFGSVAAGRNRRGSDLDIAVMTDRVIEGFELVQMETALSNLVGCDVDLVVFGQASPLLQHQILKYGRLVYGFDSMERVTQEVSARRQYLDTRSLYKELDT